MTEELENELTSIPNGKAGLIEKIKAKTYIRHSQTLEGIGDDAAVLDYQSENSVISTTMFVEGIHFDLTYTPIKHLGYKVVVAAITDILAMNATPRQVTIALAISNKVMQQHVLDFYDGVHAACKEYDIDLIGGDITTAKAGVSIAATAIGGACDQELVYRNGAHATDLICVTGNLGGAYMGLQLLEREKVLFNANPEAQPQLAGNDYILKRQLKPEAQCEVLNYLRTKQVKPTAMISVSSGLATEIINICRASKVGCEIFEERIPIHADTEKMAKEFNINPIVTALNGGEDYELLFTIPLMDYEKIKDNDFFAVIGSINKSEQGSNIVLRDGSIIPLEPSLNQQTFQNA
ncbi:MAG: thiamine-phosphate kinase [Bacteroidales bacterium]|nr:thiamine-phosphate kinase [Bacteroidales bacterium]